ncbi:MAG TPA: DUF6377 domain-containing protein [Saprospiraceae bacterium]|nr:DUF6377 domain-containing protein [Saprospiraceae bacterium]
MKKSIKIIILLLLNLSIVTAQKQLDILLGELDKTISEKSVYSEIRERRIDSLQTLINQEADLKKRYDIYQLLFKEYRHYNMNSALSVAEKKLLIAEELNDKQLVYFAKMNTAEILGIMGMYKESLDITNNIVRKKLDKEYWPYYFHLYHSLYSLMSANSLTQYEKNNYDKLISQYKDSILQIIDLNSLGYQLVKNGKLLEQGRYEKALHLMNQCYNEHQNDDVSMGMIAYGLSQVYEKKGNKEKEMQFLAISAISDLKKAVKGYIALRKLAVILFQEGQINRAYTYIKCSLEDASFCNARFRVLEISETLPIITAAYDKKIKQEKQRLIKYLGLISILSVILVISIFLIWRQINKLSFAKKSMHNLNEELKQVNKDLDHLNKQLSETNQIKEEYIGSVFNFYSDYINKLEKFRLNLNHSLVTNKLEEARRMTSLSLVPAELKEFYKNFDAIFLNIFPNFLEEFNELLKDNERILSKTGDILTPELRVFALIRLGITDSSKIASFLHYSPQTVYNYKLKIKNKLKVSKIEFAEAMHKIGK